MVNVAKHLKIPISVKHYVATDDTGYTDYGPPTEYKCYIEEEVKTIIDENGEEVVCDTTVYLDGITPVEKKDVLTIDGVDRRIKGMEKVRSKKGKLVLKVVYL